MPAAGRRPRVASFSAPVPSTSPEEKAVLIAESRTLRTASPSAPHHRRALVALLASFAVGASACATGPSETEPLRVETGRRAETTPDGLVRATGSAFQGIWVKPDANIAAYDALMIGNVDVAYKRKPTSKRYSQTGTNFALSEKQMQDLRDLLREAFVDRIDQTEGWSLAEAPGTHTLLLDPSLIDLIVKVPTDPHPSTLVYTTSAGQVTLLLEVRDSLSHELIARIADRQEARQPGQGHQDLRWSNAVSDHAAVKKMFRRWARLLLDRLDSARALDAGAEASTP